MDERTAILATRPDLDHIGRPLPGSEYIGENRIRVYLSVVHGQWEMKRPLIDIIRPAVEYHMTRCQNDKPTLSMVNSFSLSEIDAEMVVAAKQAFDMAVREFKPHG